MLFFFNNYYIIGTLEDPLNSITHFVGAFLSLVGMILLNMKILRKDFFSTTLLISCNIFCISLIGLYTSSGLFHGFGVKHTHTYEVLRRLDHSMVYVLIAGSYCPFSLVVLKNSHGTLFFASVAAIGLFGIVSKLVFINAFPPWFTAALYIAMGWIVVPCLGEVWKNFSHIGFILLFCGGVAYTIGGVLYAIRPAFLQRNTYWRAHEVFHLFIILGSFIHFLTVYYPFLNEF